MTQAEPTKILRRKEVQAATGLSRSSIYQMMNEGRFPRPIRLGLAAVGWRLADLEAWLASREAA